MSTNAQTPNPSAEATSSPDSGSSYEPFSWLNDDSSSSVEESPDTSTETMEEESPASPETASESQPTEETGDDWLPDEQEKQFPVETLAKYATRFGYSLDEVQADPRLQRALKDKINSDILIRQMQQAAETEEEPTLEPEAPAPDAKPTTPDEQRQHYQAQIDQLVQQAVDPNAATEFGQLILESIGIDAKKLNDPSVSEEDKAVINALLPNATRLGQGLATKATDLVVTILPHVIDAAIEAKYPGMSRMYERSLFSTAWDEVRSRDTNYSALPAWGTEQFKSAIQEAVKQIPHFDKMQFPGNRMEVAQAKYEVLAKIMSGQKVTPAEAAKTVAAAKAKVQEESRIRAQGKALGAGQGSKQFGAKPTGNEDIFGDGAAEFARRHGRL